MRFRVLGQLCLWNGTGWAPVRAAQQRQVLAVLLAEPRLTVSATQLVDELWGDSPPRTAVNTIQGYVMRLRRALGGDAGAELVTRDRGYQLLVADEQVDSRLFEQLVDAGHRNLAAGRMDAAVGQLKAGLALWRGPALDDVPASPAVTAEAARLEQRRLTALAARLGADLALGRHADVVDELQGLVEMHPLREELRAHLMMALYRCGRRADALAVYREGRAVLVAELGMEPGPALRKLEAAVLADEPSLTLATETVVAQPHRIVPAQIPAGARGFTGREEQIRALDEPGVAVSLISGMAGVGKTALAAHWAHRVRDRFGDGQLYVNLRGNSGGPALRPIEALAQVLHSLGVAAERVPVDLDEAAALYRSMLADRRMLIVLDDANHPDQVRPLLPGVPGCLVLVTSRGVLAGLVARDGAHSTRIDVLAADEAVRLLVHLLGTRRAAEEPDAVAELASLCAYLPLALRIAAANLIADPGESIGAYAKRLRVGNRLAALEVEGDAQAAVRASFDLSYAALPAPARRLFRLIGSVPGTDVTAASAAAVAGITDAEAESLLSLLTTWHLLDEHTSGRYRCHDLLRLYAAERSQVHDIPQDRYDAVDRLHDWYLRTVDSAAQLLYPQMLRLTLPAGPEAQDFGAHGKALEWLDSERPNLVAMITDAAGRRPRPVIWQLADALRGYFWLRMYTVDWLTVASAGLSTAEAAGDSRAKVVALLSLADAHFRQGKHQQAVEFSRRALEIARQADWPEAQAAALGNLANLHMESGRPREAAELHREALASNRRTGRRTAQANNLSNLGLVYRHMGDLRQALATYHEALAVNRELGSPHAAAVTLGNLGGVLHDLGRFAEAMSHLEEALAMHREVGDRGAEADARGDLAAVYRDGGHYGVALDHAHAALALARDSGDAYSEADALCTLGLTYHRLGNPAQAVEHHVCALDLARDTAYCHAETRARIGLADSKGNLEDAEQALEQACHSGYRVLEGQARVVVASLRLAEGRPAQAREYAEQALSLHKESGHVLGEARALLLLSRLGADTESAALTLFAQLGAPLSDNAVELLDRAEHRLEVLPADNPELDVDTA